MNASSSESPLLKKAQLLAPWQGLDERSDMMKRTLLGRKVLLVLLCGIAAVGCLLGIYTIQSLPVFGQNGRVRAYLSEFAPKQGPRTILLWNSFFGDKRWDLPADTLGPDYFRDELNCRVYRCELTNVRYFLPSVDMYDAIVFHTAEPFPLLNSVPSRRSPRQFYVFALMEPPGETKHLLSDEGGFYNLTMTYRLDSDIVWPYKLLLDAESGRIVAPTKYPVWRTPPSEWNDTAVWQLWPEKTHTAAWFVSHCETLSQREKLAAQLQQYIDIDIFGKCGNLSCQYTAKECDEMLDTKYKFYLSFENALCTDYVTEKLYNAMERNVIPIVFGGANYSQFLPPLSYVNAEDFETAAKLASHIQYLSTHPKEYLRYFWWRRYYRLSDSHFCDLCEKLHSPTDLQKSQTYLNIEKWWMDGSCRLKSRIHF